MHLVATIDLFVLYHLTLTFNCVLCYTNTLQLAIQDSVKENDLLMFIFYLGSDVFKHFRCSPRRTHALNQRKEGI